MSLLRVGSASASFLCRPCISHARPITSIQNTACTSIARHHSSDFLQQVQETTHRVLRAFSNNNPISKKRQEISEIPQKDREAFITARRLQAILGDYNADNHNRTIGHNRKCPRCWLIEQYCICDQCPPLEDELNKGDSSHKINRIFVLMHHQEVCLSVDTSKLILTSFPQTARLVVSGMGPEYQNSMNEMLQAMKDNRGHQQRQKCLVLFPAPGAKTFAELLQSEKDDEGASSESINLDVGKASAAQDSNVAPQEEDVGWDLIVIDGTWSQARKLHDKYIPSEVNLGPRRVQLTSADVHTIGCAQTTSAITSSKSNSDRIKIAGAPSTIDGGCQLRKHPIQWREISTLEALRLLLRDILTTPAINDISIKKNIQNPSRSVWETLTIYHDIANAAARHQRGR